MIEQYDPNERYDLLHEGDLVGEFVHGVFYEGPREWNVGELQGNKLIYDGAEVGYLNGLTLYRNDGVVFRLIPQRKTWPSRFV